MVSLRGFGDRKKLVRHFPRLWKAPSPAKIEDKNNVSKYRMNWDDLSYNPFPKATWWEGILWSRGAPSFYPRNAANASHFLRSWLVPAAITYTTQLTSIGKVISFLNENRVIVFFILLEDYMLIVNNINNIPLISVKKVKITSNLTTLIEPSLTLIATFLHKDTWFHKSGFIGSWSVCLCFMQHIFPCQ